MPEVSQANTQESDRSSPERTPHSHLDVLHKLPQHPLALLLRVLLHCALRLRADSAPPLLVFRLGRLLLRTFLGGSLVLLFD